MEGKNSCCKTVCVCLCGDKCNCSSSGNNCCCCGSASSTGASLPLVQRKAPGFKAQAVLADGSIKEVSLDQYKGKYVLLFFYPFDFTFVCPTEIVAFDKAVGEFEKRGVQLLGCSVDSQFTHARWRSTPLDKGGIGEVKFPLLADVSRKISSSYGVLLPDGMSLRGLFLIDKNQIVRHSLVNDLPLGRSVDEAIRMVDALTFIDGNNGVEVCPANWKKGASAMKPTSEGVASYLAQPH